MKLLLFSATVLLFLTVGSSDDALEEGASSSYSFDRFLADHGKEYYGDEYNRRQDIFLRNLETIIKHNHAKQTSKSKSNYTMGVNRFADMLPGELPLGYDKSLHSAWKATKSSSSAVDRNLGQEQDAEMDPQNNRIPFHLALPVTLLVEDDEDSSNPADETPIPNAVDWRTKGQNIVTPVKNQGHCGSCWAFAATAALESHIAIQTGTSMVLSVQELVSCVPNPHECGGSGGCTGSTAELAYDYVSQNGMVDEWQFSYQSFHGAKVNCTLSSPSSGSVVSSAPSTLLLRGGSSRNKNMHEFEGAVASIAGFSNLPTNRYHTLLSAVALLGPVVISVAASHWGMYQGGIFDDDKHETRDIDHAVVLEGYGTDQETGQDYWLVRNSWGPMWGEGGYIRLKRVDPETLDDPETDCKMDITPSDGIACTKDDQGSDITPPSVKVCGTSGVLFDGVIPIGGHLV